MTATGTEAGLHIPIGDDGTLPSTPALLHWLRLRGRDAVPSLPGAPFGNAGIPALCDLAGIPMATRGDGGPSLDWKVGPHSLALMAPSGGAPHRFHGPLPVSVATDAPAARWQRHLRQRLARMRLEEASAVLGAGRSCSWTELIEGVERGVIKRPPPIPERGTRLFHAGLRVWNPLPLPRRCQVGVPTAAEPPAALRDERGAVFPVQGIEGAAGREWLTSLELGPLESRELVPHGRTVGGAHWEIAEDVLDNGRVRAELDADGRIERLCFDGSFQDLLAPLPEIVVGGEVVAGRTTVKVFERGPVRGRIAVDVESERGVARITYTLHAFSDLLHVGAQWFTRGDRRFGLRHPIAWRGARVRCAGDLFPWEVPLDDAPSPAQRGLRWAQIGEAGGGRALAVIGREPFDLRADLGQFEVLGDGVIAYALADAGARPPGFCARAALSEAIPGEPSADLPASPPALRLADPGGLVPLWIDRPKGQRGRAWLYEVADGAGRALFYPREAEVAELVDADGEVRRRLEPTREGDGFELPYAAHELLLLRWR